ncbi:MAG: hypothetical protein JRF33_01380 [Deltaproteobacteria bacterium]|nr:hypothetical protein [Deltaproteobacteria bacterium]
MSRAAEPEFEPGRAYRTRRTRNLRRFSANPARLAKRLVREGRLIHAAHGIYYAPVESRFGQAPPSETELMRAFLDGSPFLITGPPKWNALGLGATAMFSSTLVYNQKRSGEFFFDGRRFLLRRVLYPENPSPEWFIIDLLQHHDMAGVSLTELQNGLVATLKQERWNRERLFDMAKHYGTKKTLALVTDCLRNTRGE